MLEDTVTATCRAPGPVSWIALATVSDPKSAVERDHAIQPGRELDGDAPAERVGAIDRLTQSAVAETGGAVVVIIQRGDDQRTGLERVGGLECAAVALIATRRGGVPGEIPRTRRAALVGGQATAIAAIDRRAVREQRNRLRRTTVETQAHRIKLRVGVELIGVRPRDAHAAVAA
jgi:hypothetical protein